MKTVQLDIPVMFLIGLVIAGVAAKQIKAEQPGILSRYVLAATAYAAWFGLTVAYFYFQYTGWMWSYWVDPATLPLVPSFLLFWAWLALAGFCGAVVGQELLKAHQGWLAVGLGLFALGTWAALFQFTYDAYMHVGTYGDYLAGQAQPLQGHSMQGPMGLAAAAEVLPALLIAGRFLWQGRKLPSRPSQA